MPEKPESCQACPLYHAPGPVWHEGDPRLAKFIYCAQNPGSTEVQLGRPLIGPSGNIFNRQLTEAGIRRSEIYITNQVKCMTPDNREPTSQEIKCCKHFLERELEICKADTVVLAGAVAFNANVGDYSTLSKSYRPTTKRGKAVGIMSRMGCVEQRAGRKWIGTIHPAHIMRMPDLKFEAIEHLQKAWQISGVDVPLPGVNIEPSESDIKEALDYVLNVGKEFSDDVETVGMAEVDEDDYVGGDWKLTMVGLGWKPYHAIVVAPEQAHLLAPAFALGEAWRYEHNGEYDQYYLEKIFGLHNMQARKMDTMLATHYLRNYAPKKLKPACVSRYTLLPYYGRDLATQVGEKFYNGMDCIATLLVAKEERRQLEKWNLWNVFMEFGQPLLPILEEWRRVGINIDIKKALLFKQVIEHRIARANAMLSEMLGPFFSINSPKQVAELLYKRWELPPQYVESGYGKDKERRITTNYEARKRLRWWIESGGEARLLRYKAPYIFLQLADYHSGEEKKLEYIGRISGDGRIHPYYKAHGERPFRLSSSPNVQNIPVYDIAEWGGARRDDNSADPTGQKKVSLGSLRSMVVADHPDDWLLSCDFEQLQLWILAAQFKCKWLLDIYERGEYIYGAVYEDLYKEPFFQPGKPKTKKWKLPVSEQRIRRVKAVPLGFVFGRHPESVAQEYGWTPAEGRRLYDWWFGHCPELKQMESIARYQVTQKGWMRHCFGQICWFPNGKITEAMNSFAQSPEAFVMIGSIIQIDKEFKRRQYQNTRIILSVHDQILANIPNSHVEEVYEEVIKPVMERPVAELGGFKFRHSAELSRQWDWEVVSYDEWKLARATGTDNIESVRGKAL